ncbi:MAG: hemin uptake protein HemP [Hydrogenophilales bacterium 12-61-10]|nr:MAG: hemin uptake protein HemP [Hydrogenophilales bacterium 12-61-10]OYX27897.1 MAG: hemin uptake protein HemP [Hydrogenophilales bacterium 32-62-9]OYZ03844.1 MAG: hemin uptake protein HemP [Hydrogenophilales bacterium 16-64-46]
MNETRSTRTRRRCHANADSLRSPIEPGQRTMPPGIIQTDFLFRGNQEILISHNGEHYRLRITKNGK